MSVLIKGMKMPKNCYDCPLNYDGIDCMVADNALREKGGGDFLFDHERHPNCPLIPVPKHGKLIEEEPIIKYITDGLNIGRFGYDAIEVLAEIEYAPTIIPAEEE